MSAQVSDIEAELERLRAIKAGPPRPTQAEIAAKIEAERRMPYASFARSGAGVSWFVWPSSQSTSEHVAEGRTGSVQEAEAQIRGRFPVFVMGSSWRAKEIVHRRAVERRAAKAPTGASETKPLEYLYRYSYWPTERWVRHRVVSKTERRVYVAERSDDYQRDPALPPLESWRVHEVTTRIVDRKKLESTGRAVANLLGELLTEAAMASVDPTVVGGPSACLADLGLSWPTTRAAVRKAFRRLAKTAHPDHGGSNEAFIKLRASYDAALRTVGAA